MKNDKRIRLLIVLLLVFVVGAFLFMFGGNIFNGSGSGGSNKTNIDYTTVTPANGVTEEITKGVKVEQYFVCPVDTVSNVAVVFSRQYSVEDCEISIELLEGKNVLAKQTYNVKDIEDQHRTYLETGLPISGLKNKELMLRIRPVTESDTGLAIMMNDSTGGVFSFDKKNVKGTLCFSVSE